MDLFRTTNKNINKSNTMESEKKKKVALSKTLNGSDVKIKYNNFAEFCVPMKLALHRGNVIWATNWQSNYVFISDSFTEKNKVIDISHRQNLVYSQSEERKIPTKRTFFSSLCCMWIFRFFIIYKICMFAKNHEKQTTKTARDGELLNILWTIGQ